MTGPTKKAAARRSEILAAAGICFSEKGIKEAKIDDICGKLNISPGHLYYYFKSKSEIIDALIDAHTARIEQRGEELLNRPDALNYFLCDDFVSAQLEADDNESYIWEIYTRMRGDSHMAEKGRRHWQVSSDALRKIVLSAKHHGHLRPDADVDTVLTLLSMMVLTAQFAEMADPDYDLTRYQAALRLALKPFTAEP
ncbi:MAG: TetR/AcrR family transcriptional regulator [Pseudomonadota bacterium]|jgi:AcrR family transcriptional regulator